MATTQLSRSAFERLQAEFHDLTTRGRIEVAHKIETARLMGDLSENGDYHAAKDEQGHMEGRIRELEHAIEHEVDQFVVVEDAMESREIAQTRQRLDREAKSRRTSKSIVSLEDFMNASAAGEKRTLRIVIKADQGGPAEALADALGQLSHDEVSVDVIHRGVGSITESDILLARASGAIIVGFHVRPDNNARAAAEREGVDIKLYKVIYEAVEDVRAALEGMLRPEEREVVLGEAEVRETFKVPKLGLIAGCSVRNGVIITPPLSAGALEGITQSSVMRIARDLGFDVRVR